MDPVVQNGDRLTSADVEATKRLIYCITLTPIQCISSMAHQTLFIYLLKSSIVMCEDE